MTEPFELDAVAAVGLIRRRRLSPSELVRSCLDRIEAVDPHVNAMVTRAGERALVEAAAADGAAVSRAGGDDTPLAPLHGLPVAIKDLQATEGIRTTLGSAEYADHVPEADAGIVARVRAAGGIVIGKTNIPERSIGANTVNRLFGATGNPFDPTRSCGGSSGGSAVALATDMAPLATGSDHGGSLRIPACYCGVVGHRATPGVVPFDERKTAQTFYSVQGPMGRTVADTALLLSVVADRSVAVDRRDPMAFPLDAAGLADLDPIDPSTLRLGVSEDLGGVLVSEPIRRAFRRRVDALQGLVGECVEVDLDLTAAADVDWKLRADVFVTQYHAEVDRWDDGFNPNIGATYDSALTTSMEDIARARGRQVELYQQVASHLPRPDPERGPRVGAGGVDAIVCPGVSVSPFPWSDLFPRTVDGAPVENYMAWLTLTAAVTVVGHPVTALPAGTDEFGFPFGVQLIGSAYGDRRLLSVAAAIEAAFATDPALARPRPDIEALRRTSVDLADVEATLGP